MRYLLSRVTAFGLLLTLAAGVAAAQGALAPPAVFPNPHASGPLTVHYDGAAGEAPTLELFDVLGRQVTPSSALPAGTYLLRLRYDDGRVTGAGRLTKLAAGPLEVAFAAGPAEPALRRDAGAAPGVAPGAAPLARGGECNDCPFRPGDVPYAGLLHTPDRGTRLQLQPQQDALLIRPGSTGQTAFSTCLARARGWRFEAASTAAPLAFRYGTAACSASLDLRGSVDGTPGSLLKLTFACAPEGVTLSLDADAPWPSYVVEVLAPDGDGGTVVVGRETVPATGPVAQVSGAGGRIRLVSLTGQGVDGSGVRSGARGSSGEVATLLEGDFRSGSGLVAFRVGGNSYTGSTLRVGVDPGTARTALNFEEIKWTAVGVGAWAMTDARFVPAFDDAEGTPPWVQTPDRRVTPQAFGLASSDACPWLVASCLPGFSCPTVGVSALPFSEASGLGLEVSAVEARVGAADGLSGASAPPVLVAQQGDLFSVDFAALMRSSHNPDPFENGFTVSFGGVRGGGTIMRMDKEFCNEFTSYELVYVQNGRVRARQTFTINRNYRLPQPLALEGVGAGYGLPADPRLPPGPGEGRAWGFWFDVAIHGGNEWITLRPHWTVPDVVVEAIGQATIRASRDLAVTALRTSAQDPSTRVGGGPAAHVAPQAAVGDGLFEEE